MLGTSSCLTFDADVFDQMSLAARELVKMQMFADSLYLGQYLYVQSEFVRTSFGGLYYGVAECAVRDTVAVAWTAACKLLRQLTST